MLAHLGNMQCIRGGVKGEVDHWPLMAGWVECKTKMFAIESNRIEVSELMEGSVGKGFNYKQHAPSYSRGSDQ